MSKTLVIAKRELSSLFFSPVAYVALVVFALVSSLFFVRSFYPGLPAEMRAEFLAVTWLLVFIVPALSMGLLSEEIQSGTLELLMTSPLSDVQVVVGKWLGALGFLFVLLTPLLVHAAVLELTAAPDYGPIFSGLLGLVLLGALYLAIGLTVSAATQSQFIALVVTILIIGFLSIGLTLLSVAGWVPYWLREAMYFVNTFEQYADFAKGLINTSNFVFFLSATALFLFFAVLLLQSRRWR